MFAKALGHNNLYLFFLQTWMRWMKDAKSRVKMVLVPTKPNMKKARPVEPDLTTAIISHQVAWNKTSDLSMPIQCQMTNQLNYSGRDLEGKIKGHRKSQPNFDQNVFNKLQ